MTITIDFFPSGALRTVPLAGTAATLSLAIAFAAMATESARAQMYPARPITMVVGYGVGGPSDTIARIVADRMKSVLGQPIVIENVTGAAGSLGLGRLARSAPDGYTIGIGDWSTLCVNAAI
jgi:tripartite-type tricarboxylate transporter receptor subunit TctC